ncbi:hypothetical protein KVR01_005600 [Diaporthe batatas]|uniref:uncharacterized protein n=1 Tax=Diaporthe batatas TaxID=748121 RepID=UPI001D040152|nr:uncharacterized protein KVR01_005600 [Diaporthe batatas]KAG8165325.1 hypothetical protein KVR01_005600 [Diaporthe batatas]
MAHLRPPPLLLTKRLTSFLQLNLSAQITTLLLLTPDGKLLAYASQPPIPVVTLRTHGTVAASLYTIHSNGADQDTIDAALPPGSRARRASRGGGSITSKSDGPLAVTIQLESGTVLVIRRLRCGMLFPLGSPPETASIHSAATGMSTTSTSSTVFGAGTAGVAATRRHAEELARWLDDKLGALDVPEDGLTGVVG